MGFFGHRALRSYQRSVASPGPPFLDISGGSGHLLCAQQPESDMKFNSVPHKGGRGRPATAGNSAVTTRLPERTILAVDEFAVRNGCTRSEAIHRLAEIGLAKAPKPHRPAGHEGAKKASELASKQIDYLIDPSATDEERQKRKHRILKGPAEFRDMRRDRPRR